MARKKKEIDYDNEFDESLPQEPQPQKPVWNPNLPAAIQDDVINYCKNRCLQGAAWPQVNRECQVPWEVWAPKEREWIKERKTIEDFIYEEARGKVVAERAKDVASLAFSLVENSLLRMAEEKILLAPEDMVRVANIGKNAWGVGQVEDMRPTSIAISKSMSPEQAMELLDTRHQDLKAKHAGLMEFDDEAEIDADIVALRESPLEYDVDGTQGKSRFRNNMSTFGDPRDKDSFANELFSPSSEPEPTPATTHDPIPPTIKPEAPF